MKAFIEKYRGWDIYFDTERQDFDVESNEYDMSKVKKSYESSKKFVDDFIKENNTFNTFWVHLVNDREAVKVIGIRKDGRFVSESTNGVKKQISDYYEKDYFVLDKDNDEVFDKLDKLDLRIDELKSDRSELLLKLKKITLKDVKDRL